MKEQSSGLYAQKMAELGFFAIAFDPSYTGESGGTPRYVASPDINTEDFCAAVDFLSVQESVDPERIGIIGICGWGGMAVNAAAIDTRIKAAAAMTMYDMTRVTANGYFDAEDSEQARFEKRKALNAQRTEDYKNGSYALAGGVADPLPEDAPQFVADYYAYYKTPRGYHPRSLNSNGGWNVTSSLSFLNMPILQYSSEIRSAVLLVHGEKAHSRYFSEAAYGKLTGDNKDVAQAIADVAGVDDVRASLLQAQKIEAIKNVAPENRPVVMTGDGINDAPSLTAADVGIAMGAKGATAASESADAVIMVNDLSKINDAVAIAKHTMKVAEIDVITAILVVILLELVAFTGLIPAFWGAVLQEVVDMITICLALLAKTEPNNPKQTGF